MFIPDYVAELLQVLHMHQYEGYIVGGAVRNYLLGLPAHDYDVTTNALPSEMKELFSSYPTIDTGIQHGTVTVLSHHHPVEITTYRKDSGYSDHRHPNSVTFTSQLFEDCKRRDFTINALCYSEESGILDFFHGREDLKNHCIRCIGNPEERFEEDALRILRALRFAARLNFTIEEATSRTLIEKKETLSYVSIERITSEWTGLLESAHPVTILEKYRDVIEVFLPEFQILTSEDYARALRALAREESGSAHVRMAILLSFLNNLSLSRKILKRMKYSNDSLREILNLLETKDLDNSTPIALRKVLACLTVEFSTYLSFQKVFHCVDALPSLYTQVSHDAYCYSLKQLAVNGSDLKKAGYTGKQIGETLHFLLQQVMEEKLKNRKEILLKQLG